MGFKPTADIPTVEPTINASWIGVLKTLSSPNFCAKVAASLKTPPNRPPTSCPYNKLSGCFFMISSTANKAQSTITTFSSRSGFRSPTSSVIGVGAKSCVNKSSGLGSSACWAFSKSFLTTAEAVANSWSISCCENPASNNCWIKTGNGSRDWASSRSSRYHSIRTPDVW